MTWWGVHNENGSLQSEQYITYNESGQVASEANRKDPKAKFYRKVVYSYDNKGNQIKKDEFDENGLWQQTIYNYEEFDSFGNWTKRTAIYQRTGEVAHSEETYRTITFHDK